jgi:hypothetical protein
LYDAISKRKSFRSFSARKLEAGLIDGLVDFLSGLSPPEEDIDWNFDTLPYADLVGIAEREPGVRAERYLVLRAERKSFSLQKAGYIGEMAALYLTSLGVATCWQGCVSVPRAGDFEGSLPYVSTLAFGLSDEAFRRGAEDFDRKPLNRLAFGAYGPYGAIIEAARLAPSSHNRQPCVFVADDRRRLHLFRKRPPLNNPIASYAYCVDAGAALAHIEVAARKEGFEPKIARLRPEPGFKRFVYQATVELK